MDARERRGDGGTDAGGGRNRDQPRRSRDAGSAFSAQGLGQEHGPGGRVPTQSTARDILDWACVARGANVRRLGDQAVPKQSVLTIPYRVKKGKKRLIPGD